MINKLKNNSSKILLLVLCCFSIILVTTETAYAESGSIIRGCYNNKTGVLRKTGSTGKCLTGETRISWNSVGPQGLPGPKGDTGAQGPAGSGGLRVVDSLGQDVGNFQVSYTGNSSTNYVIVYNADLDKWFSLMASTNGFAAQDAAFLYVSSDCSGTPILYYDFLGGATNLAIPTLIDSDLVYYPNGSREVINFASVRDSDNSCIQDAGSVGLTTTSTFHLSDLGFVPPFHLEK